MKRRALIITSSAAVGGVIGLAYVGFLALIGTYDLPALPAEEAPTCEVIERGVRLHTVDMIVVPGQDDPIPMSGALINYDRIVCNGVEFLMRADLHREEE